VAVIADIVGVPRSDGDTFRQWAHDGARLLMSGRLPVDEWVKAAEGFVAMQHYLADLVSERKGKPAPDLLTTLIEGATDSNGEVDVFKAVNYATSIFFAGHKTTTDLIGNAISLLLQHPAALAALVADASLAPAAIEETLRRDSPVPGTARVTNEDVTIGNVTIPKGGRVLLLLGSANQDEAVFKDPSRFDPQRLDVGEHLAFGRGVHFCIGAPLARLQGKVALQVLTQRLRGLRFADKKPVKFWQVTMFRGPVTLDVAWDKP
jgi:cytochrome P450